MVKITLKGNNNSLTVQENYFCNGTFFLSCRRTHTDVRLTNYIVNWEILILS